MIFPLTFRKKASHASPGAKRLTSFVQKFCRNFCRSAPATETADQPTSSAMAFPLTRARYWTSKSVGSMLIFLAIYAYDGVLCIVDNQEAFVTSGQPHQILDALHRREAHIFDRFRW